MPASLQGLAFAAFDRRLDPAAPSPLVVALSGGSDSLALLHLTSDWAREQGRAVLAVTVDHQLNPLSAAWTQRAGAAAVATGAAFRAMAWEGPKPATGLPAAARAARHRLLAQAAREAGAGVVLLGHTRDDVAETALMRQRGSSLGGLAQWTPSPVWPQGRGLFHFRPLLDLTRADLRRMLRDRGVAWIEDPANSDPRFARARARADLAAGAVAPNPAETADLTGGLFQPAADGSFTFARADLPTAFQLQRMLACAAGAERPARSDRVAALHTRLSQNGAWTAALGGARIEAGDTVHILREAGEGARGGLAPMTLDPGQAVVWDGRFELRARRPGFRVQALHGHAAALPREQQQRLKAYSPAARRALPLLSGPDGAWGCPVLAEDADVDFRSLAAGRYLAACGQIAREA